MTRAVTIRRALVVAAAAGALAGCGAAAGAPAAPVASRPTAVATPGAAPTTKPRATPTTTAAPAAPGEALPGPSGASVAPVIDPALRPVRLVAGSVGIDTSLVDLGIATDGSLEVPTDYAQAGWLDRSPPPGSRGPAVIAGHVDDKTGPAVFSRLRDLAPNAAITVTRADGSTVEFTVDAVVQYAKDAFPTAAVYGPVPGPVLRLITCGGLFDRSTGHYRDNVVVYATAAGA